MATNARPFVECPCITSHQFWGKIEATTRSTDTYCVNHQCTCIRMYVLLAQTVMEVNLPVRARFWLHADIGQYENRFLDACMPLVCWHLPPPLSSALKRHSVTAGLNTTAGVVEQGDGANHSRETERGMGAKYGNRGLFCGHVAHSERTENSGTAEHSVVPVAHV